jgi:alpha-D-ribose 1-methylphosphonate 5-triphosphate synthase subunit PhnI
VLSHSDSVEASGFVQHLKLPHYVDFQAELSLLRTLAAQHANDAQPVSRDEVGKGRSDAALSQDSLTPPQPSPVSQEREQSEVKS